MPRQTAFLFLLPKHLRKKPQLKERRKHLKRKLILTP